MDTKKSAVIINFDIGPYDVSTKDMLSGRAYAGNWFNGIFFMFFMVN